MVDLFSDIWEAYQIETYHLNSIKFYGKQDNGYINVALDDTIPDSRGWQGENYTVLFPYDLHMGKVPSTIRAAVLYDHQSIDV